MNQPKRKVVNVELLETYARLTKQIKELTSEQEMIRPMLLEHLKELGQDKVNSDYGLFMRQTRENYSFSEKVKDLEGKVKKQKNKEIEDGTAEKKTTEFITYRPPSAF